jgi:hypothetical protein
MKGTTPLLVALGATATAAWLFAKRRKRMPQLPTGFGDPAVQKRFIVSHQAFLLKVPELEKTVEKLFDESNIKISEQADKRGSAPRTNDELVDSTVFALERAAFDDFGDLLVLACNGHGLGATKVLRSIYEQLVTAMYIAKKPAEANIFLDHGEIDSGKIIERFVAAVPDRRLSPCGAHSFRGSYPYRKAFLGSGLNWKRRDDACASVEPSFSHGAAARRPRNP